MPTLARLADDHNPPHFHVLGPNGAFMVRLDDLQVLRGTYQADAFARAVAWAGANRTLLAEKWAELNERD